jgi:hypothetical protein
VGPPQCGHPERAHFAKGMCQQCYLKDYDSKRRKRKDPSEYAPNYRKPPHKPKRMAECHPERPHAAHGLCSACYAAQRTNAVKATCHPDRPHLADGLCARCYSKRRYDQDPEIARRQARESHARNRKRIRDEMVEAYGGRCTCLCCPETNPAFLTLEHINGDGKEHRAQVGSHTYADLRRRGWPKEGYTLLCWNCNAMTRGGRTCPHMEGA